MKHIRSIFWLVGILNIGQVVGSTEWPNEPAGASLVVDCPFSNSICSPLRNDYSGQVNVYASFPNARLSPPYVLDQYMAAGSSTGNGAWGFEGLPSVREIYVGTWWSTNAEFQGNINNTNKMIFIKDQVMDNSLLSWHGLQDQPKTLKWYQQSQVNNCHVQGFEGGCYTENPPDGTGKFTPNINAAVATVAAGSGWHQIEIYLKASTTAISKNGIIRWWVDGLLAGNYTNVNLTPNGFRIVDINPCWDGVGGYVAPYRDMNRAWHHYFDHFRISIPNCGSSGCPAPTYLVINTSLSPARTGTPYMAALTADGGSQPYTWFLESGALPAGLSLNKGVISGTPTCVGRSDFTIRVTDGSSPPLSAKKSFTIITSGTGTCASSLNTAQGTQMTKSEFIAKAVGGEVTFNLPQMGNGSLRLSIHDLGGRTIFESKADANPNQEIRVKTALKSGIYIVRYVQNQKEGVARFHVLN